MPVAVNSAGAQAAAVPGQVTASCSVLHFDLGPVTLTLLGGQANLARTVMEFTAVPGTGSSMSDLLCGAANGSNDPAGLARQLNQIVSALQGADGGARRTSITPASRCRGGDRTFGGARMHVTARCANHSLDPENFGRAAARATGLERRHLRERVRARQR